MILHILYKNLSLTICFLVKKLDKIIGNYLEKFMKIYKNFVTTISISLEQYVVIFLQNSRSKNTEIEVINSPGTVA
jgi:hypothetical protein